jgi:hypothetical protein
MHDMISVQTLRSHSFACKGSSAMRLMTKEHLAWRNMRKTRAAGGTRCPTTLEDQGFRVSGQASLGSMPCGHGTKNWSHLQKTLTSTNWARFWFELSKTSNALELGTQCPQPWALGWELLGENPDCPSGLVYVTHVHNGFECPSPRG